MKVSIFDMFFNINFSDIESLNKEVKQLREENDKLKSESPRSKTIAAHNEDTAPSEVRFSNAMKTELLITCHCRL